MLQSIREARPAGARLALLAGTLALSAVLGAAPRAASAAEIRVVLEIRETSLATDDYVTWAPTPCLARLATPQAQAVTVVLTNDTPNPAGAGNVSFAAAQVPWPANTTATESTLTLTLPADGSGVRFMLAGRWEPGAARGAASSHDKDAVIEVHEGDLNGGVLGTHRLMVRVRKDATALSSIDEPGPNGRLSERTRFLRAMLSVLASGGLDDLVRMHAGPAGGPGVVNLYDLQAHRGPDFLPWHRAMMLDLERHLQAVDPSVSLPYWRFDLPPGDLFSGDFLGSPSPPPNRRKVAFAATNPLGDATAGWQAVLSQRLGGETLPYLRRNDRPQDLYETQAVPTNQVLPEVDVLAPTTYAQYGGVAGWSGIRPWAELVAHGGAHSFAGGSGNLGQIHRAARDPVFYLLHANVDRLWARWQHVQGRFDARTTAGFAPQGGFTTQPPTNIRFGHFALDTLWPWDGSRDTSVGPDPLQQRPNEVLRAAGLPPSPFVIAPPARPSPGDLVDYAGVLRLDANVGCCYDDTPFGGAGPNVLPESPPPDLMRLVAIGQDRAAPAEVRAAAFDVLTRRAGEVPQLVATVRALAGDAREALQQRQRSLRLLAMLAPAQAAAVARDVVLARGAPPAARADAFSQLEALVSQGWLQGEDLDRTVVAFRTLRQEDGGGLRTRAILHLARAGDAQALEDCARVLRGEPLGDLDQVAAIEALTDAGVRETLPHLRLGLRATDPEAQALAFHVLGRDEGSRDALRAAFRNPESAGVAREAAGRALALHDATFPTLALEALRVQGGSLFWKAMATHCLRLSVTDGAYARFDGPKLEMAEIVQAVGTLRQTLQLELNPELLRLDPKSLDRWRRALDQIAPPR